MIPEQLLVCAPSTGRAGKRQQHQGVDRATMWSHMRNEVMWTRGGS